MISKLSADNFPSRIVGFYELPPGERSREVPNLVVLSYTHFIASRRDAAGPTGLSTVYADAWPIRHAHFLGALHTSAAIEPNSILRDGIWTRFSIKYLTINRLKCKYV